MEANKAILKKMGRIRQSVWVFILIILLLEGWISECEGCGKQERDALLHLKAISGEVGWPYEEWIDGTDCCQWENIECNNRRRVSKLNLSGMRNNHLENWYLNLSDFQAFEDIKSLDLRQNHIAGFVENEGNEGFSRQTKLEELVLCLNNLSNDAISFFNGFHHLKWLVLSFNQMKGSLDVSGLCALSRLEILDLSRNKDISGFVTRQGTNCSQGILKILHLNGLKMDGNMLRKSLRAFTSIRKLHMVRNKFNGILVARDFEELVNLEHLKLDRSSNIGNQFFESIGSLTSLKVLSLSSCGINGNVSSEGWSKLKKLRELDLSNNNLEGPLGVSFINMTSLRRLDLSNNSLTGNFASNLASFTSLEDLDFSSNQFQVPASFNFLANNSNLRVLYGSGNIVIPEPHPTFETWVPKFQLKWFLLSSTTHVSSVPLPNFLIHQYNLIEVDFSGCKFQGNFPNWLLANNTKLERLNLGNCSFTGHFQLPSHVNPYLSEIDASYNCIAGQFPRNISTIFPSLGVLYMFSNAMNGSLPLERSQILSELDLSDNHFSGEMPKNLSDTNIGILKLSNNKLQGLMCPTLASIDSLEQLYLDGNEFSGGIPSCFFNASLLVLDISDNHFVGKLPNGPGNLSTMWALSIANNLLEGSIPKKFIEQLQLQYLDLSGNNLCGPIPSFLHASPPFFPYFFHSSPSHVLLNNNKFSGLATTMFNKSLPLIMLDLSNNNIASEIQHLIGSICPDNLNILLLQGNHFMGHIPSQICQLTSLKIVDISYNSFSGPIPNCLAKIPFYTNEALEPSYSYGQRGTETVTVDLRVPFTTKWRSYTYKGSILSYMAGIDFSHNNLYGSIPPELGNLLHIRALNLSHNYLSGKIPISFSNLKQIESLDLSFNNLCGEIPEQLTQLTSLEVFSLAHNNLSGSTPERKGQFMTFDGSSYEGNPFLCGPPLNRSCIPSGIFPNVSDFEAGSNGGIIDMEFFYISFVVSYISILLIMAAILYINPQWRRAWFYFIEYVISYCYYYFHKCGSSFNI